MTSRITAYRKLLFVRDSNKERESPHLRAAQGKGIVISYQVVRAGTLPL